jgi:hypothetical protein
MAVVVKKEKPETDMGTAYMSLVVENEANDGDDCEAVRKKQRQEKQRTYEKNRKRQRPDKPDSLALNLRPVNPI